MLAQVTSAVRQTRTINPKTILGFLATMVGLLFTGSVSAAIVLATTHTATGAIPFILLFSGVVFIFVLGAVLFIAVRDPSKLMLTQVSGTDYVAIQQTMLGDSVIGDRVQRVPIDLGPVVEVVERDIVEGGSRLPRPPATGEDAASDEALGPAEASSEGQGEAEGKR